MVLHRKDTNSLEEKSTVEENTNSMTIENALSKVRKELKGVCAHEMLFGKELSTVKISAPVLCPNVISNEISENISNSSDIVKPIKEIN